ncbi:MAG TPA: hypothetical protein V6D16_04070 [Candidatus Obscuribacterales bacterium]
MEGVWGTQPSLSEPLGALAPKGSDFINLPPPNKPTHIRKPQPHSIVHQSINIFYYRNIPQGAS